jgi:hypothetical protein
LFIVRGIFYKQDNGTRSASKIGKGKVKVKFSLEQVTKAQRGSRGVALLFP